MKFQSNDIRTPQRNERSSAPALPTTSRPVLAQTRSCILFVHDGIEGYPTVGLQRAVALSRVLSAELHVLRVLPDVHLAPANASDRSAPSDTRSSATPHWLERFLFDEVSLDRVHTRTGAVLGQAATCAGELRADLIVLVSSGSLFGTHVTELVQRAGLPVLVARETSTTNAILAATNLDDPYYPVLAMASELAARFAARVVAIHSINPLSNMVCDGVASPISKVDEHVAEDCAQLLASIAAQMDLHAEFVVSHEADPISAILREAHSRDADLLVVGTSSGSPWVATQIVDRARRSVLIVPLTRSEDVATTA